MALEWTAEYPLAPIKPFLVHAHHIGMRAGVVATTDYATAFADIDVALLVGARPRGPGMERKDLLTANANIFRGQGEALDKYAKKSVLVLVVGNPANTNALIASTFAPSIPRTKFSCLTRLDHNRARSMLASKLNVSPSGVKNVIIWGNHSATQFPDVRYAMVSGRNPARPHDVSSVAASLPEAKEWLRGEFITLIQQRGKAVIDRRGASSAASAAVAIVDHVRDWWCGSSNEIVSMGVYTDGKAYGVQANLIYSMPVICEGQGKVRLVTDLALDDFSAGKLKATETELLQERHLALPEQYPEAPPA